LAPFKAVHAVSLAVQPGKIFGLIGLNCAGKSTLVKMLTTMLPLGRADIAGYDIVYTPAKVRSHIGYRDSLNDVFTHITRAELESGGSYRDVQQTRRSVQTHA
jgi:ABC-2 type transport system ATP-binding protein